MNQQNAELFTYSEKLGDSKQARKTAEKITLIAFVLTFPVLVLFSLTEDPSFGEQLFLVLLVTISFTSALVNLGFTMCKFIKQEGKR